MIRASLTRASRRVAYKLASCCHGAYVLYKFVFGKRCEATVQRKCSPLHNFLSHSKKDIQYVLAWVPDGETPRGIPGQVKTKMAVYLTEIKISAYVIPLTTTGEHFAPAAHGGTIHRPLQPSQSFHSTSATMEPSGMETKPFRIFPVKILFLFKKMNE